MKTITVVSDSHGNRAALEKLNTIFSESDYIIHLGDTSSDGSYLAKQFPGKTYVLNGNCDWAKFGEKELTLQVEGVKIFASHGDAYGVKQDLSRLAKKAAQEGCQIALYGHTHEAAANKMHGITLFNPGTLARYNPNSYLYLVVTGEKAVGKIVALT